ncbi:hypothetical protein SDRG_06969 [Saprolegnia diclina VS20]|uniref:Uncharacterized protein n=1 Tax=Saprolegnia diclina (strain VS20) TaxID=1156394 RepID=T0RT81_SAPDV|nr:hypothetical protein SDRG_06969 [Saprolegnia diclina VS20]EQC35688.1 hypothetical protein SDRG_06969 [Saprolegnia diclina VS20]|eukprot:XP_008611005.1 hypothetical protein SDRG_06969 [Saprolegnia diclina VS20]
MEDVDGLRLGIIVSNVALAIFELPVADATATAPVSDPTTAAPVSRATDAAADTTARGLIVDAPLLQAVLLKAAELGFVQELPPIIQAALTASKVAILPRAGTACINFLAHAPLCQWAPVPGANPLTTSPARPTGSRCSPHITFNQSNVFSRKVIFA